MADANNPLAAAVEALEQIALAGMSGSGQESPEAMRDWHARRAWEFIGIAARALEPARAALAAQEQAEPVATLNAGIDASVETLDCHVCGTIISDFEHDLSHHTGKLHGVKSTHIHLCAKCESVLRPPVFDFDAAIMAAAPAQAQPLTPDELADRCEAWIQSSAGTENIPDAFEAGYRQAEADAIGKPAQAQPQPRGYLLHWPAVGGGRRVIWDESRIAGDAVGCPVEPVYSFGIGQAAQPQPQVQAQPLTDEQIDHLLPEVVGGGTFTVISYGRAVARAVERACAESWGVTLGQPAGKGGA